MAWIASLAPDALLGLLALVLLRSYTQALLVCCAFFTLRALGYVRHSKVQLVLFVCACDAAPLYRIALRAPVARLISVMLTTGMAAYSAFAVLRVYHLCCQAELPRSSNLMRAPRLPLRAWRSALQLQAQVFPGVTPAWSVLWAILKRTLYVVVERGEVIAMAVVQRNALPGVDWLSYLAVKGDCRRQGYARTLLACIGPVALTVRASNEPALALYRGWGFCKAAQWENYYGQGKDGLLMVSAKL